jgi:integron integrase
MNTHESILRLQKVIRRQHKALNTENTYVYWLKRYISAIRHLPQTLPSERKAEHFLNGLAANRTISASTQHQAFNAIVFFYKDVLGKALQNVEALRVTRPAHVRHAPTIPEVRALLQAVPDVAGYPTNLIARLLYGCGFRVTEPLLLRIKDVRLDQSTLSILGAKGGKDRVIPLPSSLKAEIDQQMQSARSVWQRDQQNRIPLEIPHQLGRKYPEYQFAWAWAWLFPAHSPCRHPRTGQIVRYRMHEANVQRAIKMARRNLGIMVLPHELRHGYATHCLEYGANPRAIQEAMGHKSIETTMGYLHAESLSVRSPLDTVLSGIPKALPAACIG